MGSLLTKCKKFKKSDIKNNKSAMLNTKNSFDKLLDLITDSFETRMENRKENMTNSPFYILPDLVLINIVNMLSIPDHVNFYKSCHRFHDVCKPSFLRLKGEDFEENGPRTDESFQPEVYFEGPKLPRGVNAMKMALRWKDQGWGNRKGEIYVQLIRDVPEDRKSGAYNLKSTGEAANKYPQLLGFYEKSSETLNNFSVYKQVGGKGMAYVDSEGNWVVGKQTHGFKALLSNIKPSGAQCSMTPPLTPWVYWDNKKWFMDETLIMDSVDSAVICEHRNPVGNAHHEMTRAECDLSHHDVVKKARSRDHFRFMKNVGGGGGHSLAVEDFSVIIKLKN